MERDVGIVGYLTSTPAVGGTIKLSPEDFVVEEISAPPAASAEGRFTIAQIRVRRWETNRLIREFARILHISRRRIGFAGTKDKQAITTRLFSFEGVPPESVRGIRLKDLEVLDAFRSDRGLEIGDLAGNRFQIVVRGLQMAPDAAADAVAETERALRLLGGFPSFFGVQRFGSVRPITHVVGRHLVHGEFEEAVQAYVANPLEGEDPASYEVRSTLQETGDVQLALRTFPKSYGFEKAILNHLAARPGDYVGSLRALPFNLLMMFVHGYQSFLFNRILSERMRRGLPLHEPVAGDVVLPADAQGLPDRGRTIDVTCDNLERAAQRCREGKGWVSAILFGSEPEFAGGEPGQIEKEIVASEGLRPEDFIIPEIPRISSKGTRREILAPVRNLAARVEEGNLLLSFDLTRGSYATSLVREFAKSE
ncbi:MAG TPA: tRNA pseudouridine(13) synthase TruD [Thermoplasmata archaeon]|nr:tRNA pseudouridine(13) synthase TruD [Thermoplasmata archaeon]